jgi:capsule polysaccharide modification protein KpsS
MTEHLHISNLTLIYEKGMAGFMQVFFPPKILHNFTNNFWKISGWAMNGLMRYIYLFTATGYMCIVVGHWD